MHPPAQKLETLAGCCALQAFTRANPGFVYDYQLIDVGDGPDGRGESVPVPYFFQNLAEAEYLVSLYQYMRCAEAHHDSSNLSTPPLLQRCQCRAW
jgi:hypothetical protein